MASSPQEPDCADIQPTLSQSTVAGFYHAVEEGNPDGLTIGVELEFYYSHDSFKSARRKRKADVHMQLRNMLCTKSAHLGECLTEPRILPVVYNEDDVANDLDNFIVKDDISLWGKYQDDKVGTEITTPRLDFNRGSLDMLHSLAALLSRDSAGYSTAVDSSCAYHVHIGRGNQGLSTHWIRKLMALCWSAEHLLDRLHPPARQGPNPDRHYTYCLTADTVLASRLNETFSARPVGWRPDSSLLAKGNKRILAANSLSRLLLLFRKHDALKMTDKSGNPRTVAAAATEQVFKPKAGQNQSPLRMNYNFLNLVPANGPRRTVEFRQHQGTLDPDAVRHWALLCGQLVAFAGQDDDVVLPVIEAAAQAAPPPDAVDVKTIKDVDHDAGSSAPPPFLFELLRLIGCPQDTIDFYKGRIHPRPTAASEGQ